MRLIDADKLEKEINELCCGECECCALGKCPVYNQPIVYDIDKVLQLLEQNMLYFQREANDLSDKGYYRQATEFRGMSNAYKGSIEIIMLGGVNE